MVAYYYDRHPKRQGGAMKMIIRGDGPAGDGGRQPRLENAALQDGHRAEDQTVVGPMSPRRRSSVEENTAACNSFWTHDRGTQYLHHAYLDEIGHDGK
jgi:hypothetical protein